MRVGHLRRLNNLPLGSPRPRVSDVLGDASRKEDGFLENDRELAAQISQPVVAQVHAVQQDLAACGVVKAG